MHEVPVVDVMLIVKSGAAMDPAGKYGLASFTAAMLDEGAGSRDALTLADAIDFLGASLSTGSSFDASSVRLHTRRRQTRRGAAAHGRRRAAPDVRRHRARAAAQGTADELPADARQRVVDRVGRVRAAGVRAAAPLRHAGHGRRGLEPRDDVGRAAPVPRRTLPAAERVPARRRRRDGGDDPAGAGEDLRRLEEHRQDHEAGGGGRAAARHAADLPRRQARRRADGDPHRQRRRRAAHAGLLRARRDQHHSRRLVHLAAQHEPARSARLHLRRLVGVRHARRAGAVRRLGQRADGQDGRVAARVLQGAGRHPPAGARGRAAPRPQLRSAGLPRRVRDDLGHGRQPLGAGHLRPSGVVLQRVRAEDPGGDRRRRRPRREAIHPVRQVRRHRRRRPQADRGADSRRQASAP